MPDGDWSLEGAIQRCSVQPLSVEFLRQGVPDVEASPLAVPAAWPKMFYHSRLAPKGQVFETEAEFLAQQEAGWSETPL